MSFNDFYGYVYGDQNRQVPVHLNFGKYMLERLRQMGDKVALINATTGEELAYRNFAQYSVNLATSLTKLGIGKGDVVAIGSEERNMLVPTILSIILTGATCTPYDLNSGKAALRHKMSLAKPTHFICSKLFWDRYETVLSSCGSIKSYITLDDSPQNAVTTQSLMSEEVDIEKYEPAKVLGQVDTAYILYSSGTTGLPKGIRITHLNCIVNSLPDKFFDESIQTVFMFGRWYHNYDSFFFYKFLSIGKKVVYVTDRAIHNILKCIEKYQVNIALVVPYVINLMIKEESLEKFNLDSLKFFYSRASLLHTKAIEKVKLRLPKLQNVLQGYGMTECGEPASDIWAPEGPRPGSIGMTAAGAIFKIVDLETNMKQGPNQMGEIRVTGPMFMKGYIEVDPSSYLDEEGFFKTGDVGYYDEDNYLYIVDRLREVITCRSYKFTPLELEILLEMHEKVLEAAVVGKPDPDFGELAVAFVVKKPGLDVAEQELINYIAAEVPTYMHLYGGVKFVSQLPRSDRGKILRRQLREMLH
ncbi:luciferin 4-monooxygenase-like [Maniola hyperantus]|uniref:luciferin 4-monooxygenase-like n=1 Tax=Aphantopus hyperantus TaxID=2795564 RepID=UPI001569E715|nr:4-coumarate--CoA ligase 1-like [Maniola hyperantus]